MKKRARVIRLYETTTTIADCGDMHMDESVKMQRSEAARVCAHVHNQAARPSIGRPSVG
jgi:hypothetical protein